MTTTVVITAHPAPPNHTVSVHRYDPDNSLGSATDTWVLEKGAVFSMVISGRQTMTIEETPTLIVEANNA